MKTILTKIFLLFAIALILNTVLTQIAHLDQNLLIDIGKSLLIALIIQPWVVFHLTH